MASVDVRDGAPAPAAAVVADAADEKAPAPAALAAVSCGSCLSLAAATEQIANMTADIQRLESAAVQERSRADERTAEASDLRARVAVLCQELEERHAGLTGANKRIEELAEQLSAAVSCNTTLTASKHLAEQQVLRLDAELIEAKQRVETLQSDKKDADKRNAEVVRVAYAVEEDLKRELTASFERLGRKDAELLEAQKKFDALQSDKTAADARVAQMARSASEAEEKLKRELAASREQLRALEHAKRNLERELVAAHAVKPVSFAAKPPAGATPPMRTVAQVGGWCVVVPDAASAGLSSDMVAAALVAPPAPPAPTALPEPTIRAGFNLYSAGNVVVQLSVRQRLTPSGGFVPNCDSLEFHSPRTSGVVLKALRDLHVLENAYPGRFALAAFSVTELQKDSELMKLVHRNLEEKDAADCQVMSTGLLPTAVMSPGAEVWMRFVFVPHFISGPFISALFNESALAPCDRHGHPTPVVVVMVAPFGHLGSF